MQPAESARGNIYDLGYRGYEGPRKGRGYAFWMLYLHSLKTAFGIGRGAKAKIIPISLAVLALIPATVQLGIAAVIPAEVEIIKASDYYQYIQVIMILFVAAVSPELVGRDQRNRTLPLYFSRPLTRDDYSIAKLAAMGTAVLAIVLIPQVLMFTGNALSTEDSFDYLRENADQVPAILFSGLMLAAVYGSIGVAIGCQTHRRTFASGGILAVLIIGAIIAEILINSLDGDARRYAIFLSADGIIRGLTLWAFSDSGDQGEPVEIVDLPGELYIVASLVYTAVAALIVLRRYRGIST
ncbi:MAG: ABC transporter permease [Tepidiformaceae bacterium]